MALGFLTNIFGEDGAQLVARLLFALLILILTWAVSKSNRFILRRALKAIDRAVDLMRGKDIPLGEQLEQALAPPLRFFITVLGGWIALLALDIQIIRNIASPVVHTLVAVAIFWALVRLLDVGTYYLREEKDRVSVLDDNVIHFGARLAKAGVVILAFVVVMREWGYDFGALLAGLGLGGVAVALAAQETFANLIGYFVIMGDEPFEIRDFIVVNDISGTVEHIGFRSVRIRQLDQSVAVVPNSVIASATIVNWSHLSKRRLNSTLRIAHDAQPGQVLKVVERIRALLTEHPKVLTDSATVQFVGFGDNSLDVMLVAMLDTPEWGDMQAVKQELHVGIMRILREEGCRLAMGQPLLLESPVPPFTTQSGEGEAEQA
jgi:MscS family membrane protein